MSILTKEKDKARRRKLRVRSRIKNERGLPRVSVFRSLKHIYAQLIDDTRGKTLASSSSLQAQDLTGDKKSIARGVGVLLGDAMKELGITEAVFDRGRFHYHGRVQEIAEGLREKDIRI